MPRQWLVEFRFGNLDHAIAHVDWGDVERASWVVPILVAVGAALSFVARRVSARARLAAGSGGTDPVRGPVSLTGASLAAPTSRLPAVVRGREDLRRSLRRALRRPPARVQVLAGTGGVGKSTIALELYVRATSGLRKPRAAWWVSAYNQESLVEGLVSLARVVGAEDVEVAAIRAGGGAARDRLWQLLERAKPGWLLVFDNADDPRVFDPDADGRGWLRRSRRGLVLVTSQVRDVWLWGRDARVRQVDPLAEQEAIQVLMDLAPQAAARDDAGGVRELARRLGFLPLGLQQAGTYLSSRSTQHRSFTSYLCAWRDGSNVLVPTGIARDRSREALLRTWELSLDSLARDGLWQARPLLRLLSCYAAATPVPEGLLRQPPVRRLAGSDPAADAGGSGRWLEDGIEGLDQMSLIEREPLAGFGPGLAVVVHPMVAETNRLHLNSGAVGRSAPEPAAIRLTAVELLAAALEPLRSDDNRDWLRYDILAPHVREMTTSAAGHLDNDSLAALLVATADVAAFYVWSSYETAGVRLADLLRPHAERLEPEHPARLSLEHERAWAIGRNGHWEEASTLLRPILSARVRVLGDEHPDTLDTRHKLAWATGRAGDWAGAEEQLRRVGNGRMRLLGTEHPDTLHTRGCLAWAVGRGGRPDEAEAIYKDVIAARARLFGYEHVGTWDCRHSLAELMVRSGRFEEAEELLRQLIAARGAVYRLERPETLELRPRYWLARALRGLGRYPDAEQEFRRLLADQERALGAGHPAVVDTRRHLLEDGYEFRRIRTARVGPWLAGTARRVLRRQ